jgi:hypothetical protein
MLGELTVTGTAKALLGLPVLSASVARLHLALRRRCVFKAALCIENCTLTARIQGA